MSTILPAGPVRQRLGTERAETGEGVGILAAFVLWPGLLRLWSSRRRTNSSLSVRSWSERTK
ncbi:hypothetical protein [Streptomyces avermitilis]|uniref:hypothetical protein n=1 Tax=Streptomyces avermitilis TaxID=33903 RepID=UPI00380963B0